MKLHIFRSLCLTAALCVPALAPSSAAEVKVLTAGAFKQVVLALAPDFEKHTGTKVALDNDTAGGLQKRIESGEAFDVAIITPTIIDGLAGSGKVAPNSRVNLATVAIGVVVKEGAPKPDISTVEAFKKALLAAKSVAYIDPRAAARAGSISINCSNALASPTRSGQRQSSRRAVMSPSLLPVAKPSLACTRSVKSYRSKVRSSSDHCRRRSRTPRPMRPV